MKPTAVVIAVYTSGVKVSPSVGWGTTTTPVRFSRPFLFGWVSAEIGRRDHVSGSWSTIDSRRLLLVLASASWRPWDQPQEIHMRCLTRRKERGTSSSGRGYFPSAREESWRHSPLGSASEIRALQGVLLVAVSAAVGEYALGAGALVLGDL
jgi:hypothetical protein